MEILVIPTPLANESQHHATTRPAAHHPTVKEFPRGNRAAFNAIESHLKTLRGRRFYGLVYGSESGMDYHAGLVPHHEIEERMFSELGFSITDVEGGPCARVKMLDWSSKTDQIGPTIGAMIGECGIDPSRPQVEFYRSLGELHLLVPVPRGC